MKLSEVLEREIPGTREQRSDPWFAARIGKITGSGISNCCPGLNLKGKPMTINYNYRNRYILEKIYEIVTGKTFTVPDNKYMEWGRKYEPEARELYCSMYGAKVKEVGALSVDFSKSVCVSPDGIIYAGNDFSEDKVGALEIKCPGERNHIKYMKEGRCPPDYYGQVQTEIYAMGADAAHFVSYHPEFPKEYRMFVIEVPRDDEYIQGVLIKNIKNTLVAITKGVNELKNNMGIEEVPF